MREGKGLLQLTGNVCKRENGYKVLKINLNQKVEEYAHSLDKLHSVQIYQPETWEEKILMFFNMESERAHTACYLPQWSIFRTPPLLPFLSLLEKEENSRVCLIICVLEIIFAIASKLNIQLSHTTLLQKVQYSCGWHGLLPCYKNKSNTDLKAKEMCLQRQNIFCSS